mgnify:CR=1 FL=1
MMQEVTQNDGQNDTNHIVVIGTISQLSANQITVAFDVGGTTRHITGNRADLGASGSTGVSLNDLDTKKAFSFKRCICPRCNNNDVGAKDGMTEAELAAANVRKKSHENGIYKCKPCNGTGYIKALPVSMNCSYDVEWDDIFHSLQSGQIPEGSGVIFPSVLSGGRSGNTDAWNQHITRVALQAPNPITGEMEVITTKDKDGNVVPTIIQHFNELYADETQPHGMPIGRPKTHVYRTVQHEDVLFPWIKMCVEKGLPYSLHGANYGQDAYLQIMLSKNGSRQEIINALRTEGRSIDEDTGRTMALSKDPKALISFGIQIRSSFDGSISFTAVAERVACLNGMVAKDRVNLLALSHKNSVISIMEKQWESLAQTILAGALNMWDEMREVEMMNDLQLTREDVERLAVIMEDRGIISWPGLGKAQQLTGGRVFRAMREGWANPQASRGNAPSFVAVGGDDPGVVNSLNHFYNVLTGITTHQIDANDVHGRVTGGKAINQDATEKSLKAIHDLCREVQISANNAYAQYVEESGDDSMTLGEYCEMYGIPMLEAIEADENGHYLPVLEYEQVTKDTQGKVISREVLHNHQLTLDFVAPMVA